MSGNSARPAGSRSAVYFGVREQVDGGVEHVVLEFDWAHFRLTKYIDSVQIWVASFGEIKSSQTDGTQVLVSLTNPSIPPLVRFIPFTIQQLEELCELLHTIDDNLHELVGGGKKVENACRSFLPRICCRKLVVVQKSFKRKGKQSGISKFVKKKGAAAAGARKNICFFVLTEKSLLCFEVRLLTPL